MVPDDGGGYRYYTVSSAVAFDITVPQETDFVLKPISTIGDPQTAIGQRQQALHTDSWKPVSRSRDIWFKVNAIEPKETDIRANP
jgi:hypothetical protein